MFDNLPHFLNKTCFKFVFVQVDSSKDLNKPVLKICKYKQMGIEQPLVLRVKQKVPFL